MEIKINSYSSFIGSMIAGGIGNYLLSLTDILPYVDERLSYKTINEDFISSIFTAGLVSLFLMKKHKIDLEDTVTKLFLPGTAGLFVGFNLYRLIFNT